MACGCTQNGLTSCGCSDNCPYKTSDITVFDGNFTSIVLPEGAGLNEALEALEEFVLNTVNNLNLVFTVAPGNCLGLAPGEYGYSQIFNAIIDNLCALGVDVTNLQTALTTIEGDITDIQNDITDIQNDITNITVDINDSMPLGSMIMYPVAVAPSPKWLLCEGQSLAISSYPALWALIGYNFGGAGPSFNLPDMRGKFFAGYDAGGAAEYQTIGQGAGANSVTLTSTQSGLVAHSHSASTTGTVGSKFVDLITASTDSSGGDASATPRTGDYTRLKVGADGDLQQDDHAQQFSAHTHSWSGSTTVNTVAGKDADDAHENRPEFIVFPWAIKVLN
jgi:microcystin-dependent protein